MELIIGLIQSAVLLIVRIYLILMLVRAVMSWFIVDDDENVIFNFVLAMTEPVIAPVRAWLNRFESLRAIPIDLSFIVAYFILYAVLIVLEMLI